MNPPFTPESILGYNASVVPTLDFRLSTPRFRGGLAQLGERLPCTQEVRGSNPLASTTPPYRLRRRGWPPVETYLCPSVQLLAQSP